MTNGDQLIHGFLDDQLSEEQHQELLVWIKQSPENARRFAAAALLHDRLRAEFQSRAMMSESEISATSAAEESSGLPSPSPSSLSPSRSSRKSFWQAPLVAITVMSLALSALLMFWNGVATPSANAATLELRRLLSANATNGLRTYQIVVEETAVPQGRRRRTLEDDRPPKPPMQGATLWVKGASEFVLKRFTTDGRPFVTGCDGHVSWAVNPDGPVRVSRDLSRFNHDVPGHESSMPLNHFDEALKQLQQTYDLQLLPVETPETDGDQAASNDANTDATSEQSPSSRLMVAIKKRGERGPARVEILYEPESGRIFQMRFIGMPYGPDRLTLRLTLTENESVDEDFFGHEAHHSADRRVEEE
ncbi:MAG: hypothetical protein JNM43_23115 [Planctomycetaceae bacterium]|nr:hypothetical protein [Planctomycetaceae bacterium]